ncbi:MAG: Flavodoxin/nitric oxide synthase [candidate division TM6 bacterium GW2011_GWF2_38_10]|nr:MAG: Flavodoxin/nitric oxide synthase [candidate division TM6 bacterium GW2011_GWF2_38_10]
MNHFIKHLFTLIVTTVIPSLLALNNQPTILENSVKKALIIYESQAGSTADTAQKMGTYLKTKGLETTLSKASDWNKSLDPFDLIIIGSPIIMGSPEKSIVDFAKKHQSILAQKETAVFAICLAINEPAKKEEALSYPKKIIESLPASHQAVFAGVMNFNTINWFKKIMLKCMGVKEGDYRNWNEIHAWLDSIIPQSQVVEDDHKST